MFVTASSMHAAQIVTYSTDRSQAGAHSRLSLSALSASMRANQYPENPLWR